MWGELIHYSLGQFQQEKQWTCEEYCGSVFSGLLAGLKLMLLVHRWRSELQVLHRFNPVCAPPHFYAFIHQSAAFSVVKPRLLTCIRYKSPSDKCTGMDETSINVRKPEMKAENPTFFLLHGADAQKNYILPPSKKKRNTNIVNIWWSIYIIQTPM